jgi:hypothetical protein
MHGTYSCVAFCSSLLLENLIHKVCKHTLDACNSHINTDNIVVFCSDALE